MHLQLTAEKAKSLARWARKLDLKKVSYQQTLDQIAQLFGARNFGSLESEPVNTASKASAHDDATYLVGTRNWINNDAWEEASVGVVILSRAEAKELLALQQRFLAQQTALDVEDATLVIHNPYYTRACNSGFVDSELVVFPETDWDFIKLNPIPFLADFHVASTSVSEIHIKRDYLNFTIKDRHTSSEAELGNLFDAVKLIASGKAPKEARLPDWLVGEETGYFYPLASCNFYCDLEPPKHNSAEDCPVGISIINSEVLYPANPPAGLEREHILRKADAYKQLSTGGFEPITRNPS